MTVGQTQKFSAVINDISKNGAITKSTKLSCKNLSWKSDNPIVAKIDENGNLKATCSGSTIIYASYKGLNSNTYKIEVKVKQK